LKKGDDTGKLFTLIILSSFLALIGVIGMMVYIELGIESNWFYIPMGFFLTGCFIMYGGSFFIRKKGET